MHTDEEPEFDVTITDLAVDQSPQPHAPHPSRPWWIWRIAGLLLLALLASAEILSITRPMAPERPSARTIPRAAPTLTRTSTPVSPAVFTILVARPLQFPAVAPLQTCPVSQGRQIDHGLGLAAGAGPAYVVPVDAHGIADYAPASEWGDQLGWGGIPKTLWVFPATFSGPILVRGQRLDQPGPVRFNEYLGPLLSAVQLVVQANASSGPYQVALINYIRFNAPGCYGLQVDWLQGAEIIVVNAQPGAS
jgi:hypothetical protein